MPRFPATDPNLELLGGSVYTALAARIAALEGEVYPLHIGDTWLDPDPGMAWCDLVATGEPRPHRYANPQGLGALLSALVEKVRIRNGIPVAGSGQVLMTAGATGALCAAAMATVSPGDEVLLLSPYWPLIRGAVINARGVPIEVPVLHKGADAGEIAAALERYRTPKTAAVYLNTPSNPTGRVLGEDVLQAIADFARRHDLWIWSDEVYEDYVYTGEHLSTASIAPERTLTAFSFSKAFGMAGYRCGYLVGPPEPIEAARKAITYIWYSTPTPSQYLALQALETGNPWLERAKRSYQETGFSAAERLGVEPPGGSTFLFLDVSAHLDDRGLFGFLEDCLEDHLVLAPGPSFGADFGTWVRLCFTCVPPDVTTRGVEKLARRLGR